MIFKPAQLGMAKLDNQELVEDRKSCKKIGPCGVGKKALYLNSFYIDRRYYLPYGSISRVFKRVAMSSGGFTGKGMFASMAYLVVEYDGGKQKQCNFKDERDVDALLAVLAKEQPQLQLLSAAGEQALEKKAAEKAARKLPELTDGEVKELQRTSQGYAVARVLDGKACVVVLNNGDSPAQLEFQLPVEASGVEDLLADCVGSQPILTQVEWGKLKVQLPSNYATLLRLVG